MEALKYFPKEYAQCFRTSFDFLQKFNVRYLEDGKPLWKKYWRYLFIVPALLIHICALSVRMAVMLKQDEMVQVAAMLPPFLVSIQSILKATVLIPQTSEVSQFILELGGLWRTKFTKSQSEAKNEQLGRLNVCNKATYFVTVYGSFQYLLSPLLETLVRRFILQQDCELLLPIASSYPFDPTKNWVIYILVYFFQHYTMFLLIVFYMGSELIMITSTALLGTEFLMLQDDLAQIKPEPSKKVNPIENDSENDGPTIKQFVIRHQKLIGLSRQLDNVFNRMIFINLLFVGITTCAFSFAGKFARGPIYVLNNYVAVGASMLTVLYLCYYGEILTGASANIGDVAYTNQWYNGNKQYKVAVWLIIKMSQNPCCVTSLKYAVVSLNMFSKVMSTTWSYFSLMKSTVYSEE